MSDDEVKKRVLPALMKEGMLKPEYVDLLDFDRFYINNLGELRAPENYAARLRMARPHLFKVRGHVPMQPDRLRNDVFGSNTAHSRI